MNKHIYSAVLLLAASTSLSACSYMPSWMGGRTEEKPKLSGERKVALSEKNQVQVDESLKNTAPSIPEVAINAEWAQHSGEFAADNSNLAGGKFDSKASAKIGSGNSFSHSLLPRPVVSGGMVFAMDSAGVISAHNASDISSVLWKSEAVADEDENEVMGGGLAVEGGVLYATTGQGNIAALNAADGKKLWQKNIGTPLRSSPRVADDKLIVIAIDSHTYSLSAKTGDILWDHRGVDEVSSVMNSVSPTIKGGDVLVPYSSGELFSLSLNSGKEQWSENLLQNRYNQLASVFTGIGGDPVIDDNVAFVTSNGGVTIAINMNNGKRIWQQQLASINTPWLAGDELFILTSENTLVDAVKYTGKIRWKTQLDSYEDPDNKRRPVSWRGPVMVGGNLIVVSSNGQMVFVSAASGKISQTRDIPDNILTAPVVAGGKMYLVRQDAKLYSFQ